MWSYVPIKTGLLCSFKTALVLCSVKCQGWPFGTILVWRLGPQARLAKVLSRLFLGTHARGPGAIKPRNDTLANQPPQTNITNDNKLDNRVQQSSTDHAYIQLWMTSCSEAWLSPKVWKLLGSSPAPTFPDRVQLENFGNLFGMLNLLQSSETN